MTQGVLGTLKGRQTVLKKVPASIEAGTLNSNKLHVCCDYGFSNRKKPAPLDGSMGLVMYSERKPPMLYIVPDDAVT